MNEEERTEASKRIVFRAAANIGRILRLTHLLTGALEDLKDQPGLPNLPSEAIEDVGRAIIVYHHAVMEDTLREVAWLELANNPEKILDSIPLVGASQMNQPRKFALGALKPHRGKTVDRLIQDSIDAFLDQKSFNSIDDIVHILEWCKIDVSRFRQYFPELEELIARRHQIVHKADMQDTGDEIKPIPFPWHKFSSWSGNTVYFVTQLAAIYK